MPDAPQLPEISAAAFKLPELISALSYALDMSEGQPSGHSVRCCFIGMQMADELELSDGQRLELYYTLLLKDLGSSANAARIHQLCLGDEMGFKRRFKECGGGFAETMALMLKRTGLKADLAMRFRSLASVFKNGSRMALGLVETRAKRGADLARQLRLGDAVAQGIHDLDEHWDGRGKPQRLKRKAISLHARIALICQVADVFHTTYGRQAAMREIERRSATWFEPELADAFLEVAAKDRFWEALQSDDLESRVLSFAPAHVGVVIDEDYLDDIAMVMGQVADAKSAFTQGHSARVAFYVDMMAESLGVSAPQRLWLKRAGLMHDVGKLGVSNAVLDKPDKLDESEWRQMQMHAVYTETLLARISGFSELAQIAGAHHERLDGHGYPYGLKADEIAFESRLIGVADFFDALTSNRPYREALSVTSALNVMASSVGTAIDPMCFDALKAAIRRLETDQSMPVVKRA